MRSYKQYCGLAKALDVVGDRWTLLIVRELLIAGPSRYTDLLAGLPGIATNLLADRLASMERTGLVTRTEAPPPIATTVYDLTDRGRELRDVIGALGRWAKPLLGRRERGDTVRQQWLALPLELYLEDRTPGRPAVSLEIRSSNRGERPVVIETSEGKVRARLGSSVDADASITATPELALGLLLGRMDLATARSRGLVFEGDAKVLRRFRAL